MENKSALIIEAEFQGSKADVTRCYLESIIEQKETGDILNSLGGGWINHVDPETMDFIKSVYKKMDGSYTLRKTFFRLINSKDLATFKDSSKKVSLRFTPKRIEFLMKKYCS